MRNRLEGPATLLLVVAILGSMSACADRSTTGPRSAASRGIARDVAEAPAEQGSVCPEGLNPVEVIPGEKGDANGNGIICTDGGRIIVDDFLAGSCPEGLKPLVVIPGDKGDENGNGVICTDGKGNVVDDVIDKAGGSVNGHGNFFLDAIDLSFSFHGNSDKDGDAKGEFELHDQTKGFNVHGDVVCISVTGNTAVLNGVVTNSDHPDFLVGAKVGWAGVDNGEGTNDPADLISNIGPLEKKVGKGECGRSKISLVPIISGNIQVKP
jgi:hypothetical protein